MTTLLNILSAALALVGLFIVIRIAVRLLVSRYAARRDGTRECSTVCSPAQRGQHAPPR